MISHSSSYGSISIATIRNSINLTPSSIHDGDGSSSTLLRRRRSVTESTAYSANNYYSILFFLTLTTTAIFFASCSRKHHQWYYRRIPLLLRSSSKNNDSISFKSSKKCKTLYLLRHAKSSWVNSSTIDDYDRQLSPKGRKVAHVVGTSLHKKRVDIPDVILASPSVRTRETLDIVLAAAAWERKQFFVDESKILYSKSWYDLSDEGYLNHLVHIMLSDEEEDIINKDETDHGSSIDTNNTLPNHKNIFSNVDIIMIVGHNPAIERLLNDLLVSPNDTVKQWNEFSPGHFYALRFHQLERWGDFGAYIEGGGRGVVELHLPG